MKELLFGWITKGQFQLSFLDSIIAIIEIFGAYFLIVWIIVSVKELIKKIKHKKEEKE
jgi:uncharacterized membrane protein YciS (DUF1049 family)